MKLRWLLGCVLLGGLLLTAAGWALWPALRQFGDPRRSRNFYIPAESMMPTLAVGDRVRPLATEPAALRRGMVIVFAGAEGARVDRIAAPAGDTVAIREGRVWLNGSAVPLRDAGPGPLLNGTDRTRMQIERLPGEVGGHRLLDAGIWTGDDYGPVRVPQHALFVLGDNRDRAADSRFGTAMGGVGLVPETAVIGVVDRLLWGHTGRDLGRPIDEGER